MFLELRAYLDYRRLDHPLTYWRSRSQLEVDFVVGDHVDIEVTAGGRVSPRHYRGLTALSEEVPLARRLVVCGERLPRTADAGTEMMRPEQFFEALWAGALL